MKTELRMFTGGLLVLGLVFSSLWFVEAATASAGGLNRVIVTFNKPVNEAARAALQNAGGQVVKTLPLINGAVVIVPDKAVAKNIGVLANVKRVEEDALVFALGKPSGKPGKGGGGGSGSVQPAQTLEWGVDRIDADLAWATSKGFGIDVAVIDTGIDKDHADLVGNLQGGVNFVSKPWWKDPDPNKWDDDNGHGTHVAGIIAASDNEIGVVGVAPEAYLWAVKVLNRNGSGYTSDVIAGIGWAVANGMEVINMSLGSSNDTQALHDAVDAANAAGVVVVAAAGNSGDGDGTTNEVIYPAKYASVIAVSATAADDSTPTWSSEGAEVEIAAPGVSIRSTWNDGLYNTISGTSMASPYTVGTAALVLARGVADTNGNGRVNDEVRTLLEQTADDLGAPGRDNFYGFGLVDAEEATTGIETQ